MRKLIVMILIVCLYCFPFVYFSMYQDFANGSMIGYVIMVIGTSILAFFSKLFSNTIPFIIGNILSIIISFYFLYKMEIELGVSWHRGYFKPFTPYQLLLLVSFLNVIPQFFVMILVKKYKKTG
ncbi:MULTISPECIES: hypothetical protein [Bacillus cereus group]|uniref:hypothetical protein n=1 Tax=Bacillus cereus group TaxID=86661 RepID=UPI0008FE23B4|nr:MULTISPECIES: hypothetical protein [Bacillus cereus group]MDX5838272.1 hypothetical protein [Bacillus cereus group sp. BfR-BA-01700]OJE42736.1 hypothetical protein BAQ44_08080 [Bacillus mobilis]HDR7240223.1 hypothetical protein [Bacillus mobilis]